MLNAIMLNVIIALWLKVHFWSVAEQLLTNTHYVHILCTTTSFSILSCGYMIVYILSGPMCQTASLKDVIHWWQVLHQKFTTSMFQISIIISIVKPKYLWLTKRVDLALIYCLLCTMHVFLHMDESNKSMHFFQVPSQPSNNTSMDTFCPSKYT